MNGIAAWLMGLLSFIPGLAAPAIPAWNGYVEEDYVYAASPTAGPIDKIAVQEGDEVRKGAVLFTLDSAQQQASYEAAKAQAAAAQSTLANLQSGERPEEIQVTETQLQKAQADLVLAQQTLSRTQDLFKRGNASQSQLDSANSAEQSAQSAVNTLEAQVQVAKLPARPDQQAAAQAQLAAAEAQVALAKAALDDRTVTAPEDGRIERLFFKTGEVANTGTPVLSLRGGDAMKIEFYVNEADRSQFPLGTKVGVSCDGCAGGLTATVTFLASDPEFTPPIIYSRDERKRLVFLTEATMDQQDDILPGQPVSIELEK